MPGFALAAMATIAAGLSIGAAATVGLTLVVQGGSMTPTHSVPAPAVNTVVQYGDRCFDDYCPPPCGETTPCLNTRPRPHERSRQP
ncbi:hypothetical protein MB901379_00407 [Mycobacterium basiliense]|uniref:Small secreted protein n=1 Tax=Mycobacterium basiliense TaxID=2094119 RepID=A0A3S4BBQ6_9MYCO|nr:DUF2613 family protein [Mycobacterium basiliense]VDM86880.1 hypothetical protein MB901379_00407 [Mycobacterium basiliense]